MWDLDQIAQALHPSGRLLDVQHLGGGISYQTLRATFHVDGQPPVDLIIRQAGPEKLDLHPTHLGEEFALLKHLVSSSPSGVRLPRPQLLLHNASGLPDCVVLDFTPGDPAVRHPEPLKLAPALAGVLAAIHDVRELPEPLVFLKERGRDGNRWPLMTPDELDESLRENTIRQAMSSMSTKNANLPCLLHGDYWPGNIILNDETIAAIVDWEDALFGDPMNDVAIARLDLLWCYGEAVMHAFTEHYLRITNVDERDLPYWDLFAALRPCGYLAEWSKGWAAMGRPDVTLETMARQHAWFVDDALARASLS